MTASYRVWNWHRMRSLLARMARLVPGIMGNVGRPGQIPRDALSVAFPLLFYGSEGAALGRTLVASTPTVPPPALFFSGSWTRGGSDGEGSGDRDGWARHRGSP